ncbi:MAG: hypothetical protein HY923_01735 [Elusimicrobia bacterium]|nr:hypothetical protein [Elusimicrobiota bacterium]
MKNIILAVIFTAAPAAAQTTVRAPVTGMNAIPGLGASFDGARLGSAPMLMSASPAEITALVLGASFDPARLGAPPLLPNVAAFNPLAATPGIPAALIRPFAAAPAAAADSPLGVIRDASAGEPQKAAALGQLFENSAPTSHESLAVSARSAAVTPDSSNEFAQAPAWFDVSQLKFDALVKSGTGGTAVLRYGWRSRYEMSVFAFPGSASISFKEYSANPMGHPKQSFDATLETKAARKAAAKILRGAQARNPVSGKDKAALDEILAFLDGDGRVGALKPAVAPEGYTWHDRPIKNGTAYSGEALPTVSVVNGQDGIEAAIDGKPVAIGFIGAPDGPPSAMVFKQEGETITVDLDSESSAITGALSGERISATLNASNVIINRGEGRFQMTLKGALSLTSLQAGDVPQPVRRFAAYMLILRSIIGSWR